MTAAAHIGHGSAKEARLRSVHASALALLASECARALPPPVGFDAYAYVCAQCPCQCPYHSCICAQLQKCIALTWPRDFNLVTGKL
eukprot:6213932-Pleurochrysis_carterae.AAC.2